MDRSTLTAHMDGFLAALAGRDPGRARLAPQVRYTENGQTLAIGDGAWGTVTALGSYRHDVVDPETGGIASFTTISEGSTRSILVTRLAVRGDAIADIECIAARPDMMTGGGPFVQGPASLDASGGPDPHWAAPIPESERMSRAELRRIANLYFVGLEKNDGKGDYPFADDCIRIENGFRTTGEGGIAPEEAAPHEGVQDKDTPYRLDFKRMSAKEQFETGYFAFVDRIRQRRFPVIDVERGIVFAVAFFDHSGTVRDYLLTNGRRVTAGVERPFSWHIGEAFKIERGLFTRIEAVMTACPYGMPSGWPVQDGDID
ncbi:MAG TPA: hypothetical protein VFF89_06310 [Sphingobium sp.]|nr:hypothetical protein [Sphingobium sp.]